MKKYLYLIIALGLCITSATLTKHEICEDDPPIWGTCPLGSPTCPTITQPPTTP